MLTWIALVLTLTSLFLVVARFARHRPNGIAIPPLLAAQVLLLIDDARRGDSLGVGLAVFAMVLCAAWAQSLHAGRRRRTGAARTR